MNPPKVGNPSSRNAAPEHDAPLLEAKQTQDDAGRMADPGAPQPDRARALPGAGYALDDRYRKREGRVFLTGTQALVRVMLDQARRDRAAGLNTGGFVSGYRGSPLGAVDLELWRAEKAIRDAGIEFLPAVNEDLAATAVLGSQQVETDPNRTVDGVFALWYGKGPGVDRAGDALKHGNAYGSSPHGGVLVVAGDDHGCVSSSMPHQSDVAFLAWFMPTLNPASVDEYLSFGEYGYAMSRFTGMWVGLKAISETVESAASVELQPPRLFADPGFTPPPEGLHYRWPDLPSPAIEARMQAKKDAVYAFAEANPIDRHIYEIDDASYGIVTTGKAHGDLMEALRLLGLDESECRRLGIDIYKIGMVWPLARRDALAFVRGKREILVIEEKRGIIESQFKEYFYDYPGDKPQRMVGKQDENGHDLVPWIGELSPRRLAGIVAGRLDGLFPGHDFKARAARLNPGAAPAIAVAGAPRTPYFCSGCPHNTSTRVPEGSQAFAGIGCHFMASWMDRNTTSLIQMGGEGVNWAARSRFNGRRHVFQNLGEGTYYHSGSMAIRQAIAAGTNITYKILFNDAVAMTGGQPVDGPVSVSAIAHTVRAEGVQRIAVVSNEPDQFARNEFPDGVTIHDRRELDAVQRELRDIPGVTVLIYAQPCATELRRKRKRGKAPEPAEHVMINPLVCEGCGDCSVASNCLSVEPIETPLGRKRRINPSTCNKDMSCLEGFCPSFVTVRGTPRKAGAVTAAGDPMADVARLSAPSLPSLDDPYSLLVTGVGGTGVITVGAIIAMAAHLAGLGVTVLDFTGFAQKFGPVLSFLKLARTPDELHSVRIDNGAADALIGCDVVVSTGDKANACLRAGTRAVLNTAAMPTGQIVRERDASLNIEAKLVALAARVQQDPLPAIDANRLAQTLLGDTVYANMLMLGFAWQHGLVPLDLASIEQAIRLNGVQVENNLRAFAWGRLAVEPNAQMQAALADPTPSPATLDALIETRAAFLADYQDRALADRFRSLVGRVRAAEAPLASEALTRAVAIGHFRLLALKDEYEVARLHMHPDFVAELEARFEPGYRVTHHLAPPGLTRGTDSRGRPAKRRFGPWLRSLFGPMAAARGLRGRWFDPTRLSDERRRERAMVQWHEALVESWIDGLSPDNLAERVERAKRIDQIRGFGPVREASAREVRASL
ncbi:MAG: indolepyruvate ferredoxin oxidoreductase family protein [Burkholderiaceae bacterium]